MKLRRIFAAGLVLVLIMSCLVGCTKTPEELALEIYEKSEAAKDAVEKVSMDIETDMTVKNYNLTVSQKMNQVQKQISSKEGELIAFESSFSAKVAGETQSEERIYVDGKFYVTTQEGKYYSSVTKDEFLDYINDGSLGTMDINKFTVKSGEKTETGYYYEFSSPSPDYHTELKSKFKTLYEPFFENAVIVYYSESVTTDEKYVPVEGTVKFKIAAPQMEGIAGEDQTIEISINAKYDTTTDFTISAPDTANYVNVGKVFVAEDIGDMVGKFISKKSNYFKFDSDLKVTEGDYVIKSVQKDVVEYAFDSNGELYFKASSDIDQTNGTQTNQINGKVEYKDGIYSVEQNGQKNQFEATSDEASGVLYDYFAFFSVETVDISNAAKNQDKYTCDIVKASAELVTKEYLKRLNISDATNIAPEMKYSFTVKNEKITEMTMQLKADFKYQGYDVKLELTMSIVETVPTSAA